MEHDINGVMHPFIADNLQSAWAQYTLKVDDREVMVQALKNSGIPSAVYYPKTLNQQDGYKKFPSVAGGTPVSERLAATVLSLPMHAYLDVVTQNSIMGILHSAMRK